jgi:hypothetical protein
MLLTGMELAVACCSISTTTMILAIFITLMPRSSGRGYKIKKDFAEKEVRRTLGQFSAEEFNKNNKKALN